MRLPDDRLDADATRRIEAEFGKEVLDLPDDTHLWPQWALDRFTEESPLGRRILLGKLAKAWQQARSYKPYGV